MIEAPSLPEAEAAAKNLAAAFDDDMPDDCAEQEDGRTETGDFEASIVSAEVHKASDPDYVVLADGQCVPFEA